VVWSAYYSSFGKAEVDPESTVVNNLRFPGQYFDAETGLHYNWWRCYEPKVGRYLRIDPIGFESGLNLFVYVQNSPLNWVDPSGLQRGNLYPNQKYKPTRTPKTTQPKINYVPKPEPKITPKNYNPKGINNLPGKAIPESTEISKNKKTASGIIKALSHISKIIRGGSIGPIIIYPHSHCESNPNDPYCIDLCELYPNASWCKCLIY
jgi:RHS repeat-associated protein